VLRSSARDNNKTIKEIGKTLENPVFSRVFFILALSECLFLSGKIFREM
jgi:hypothetical protein